MAQSSINDVAVLEADPKYAAFTKLFPYQQTYEGPWAFLSEVPPTSSDEQKPGPSHPSRKLSSDSPRPWPSDEDFRVGFPASLQVWEENKIEPDIDRILRGAIQANKADIVAFLFEATLANPLSRDVLERTAIFYAVLTETPTKVLNLVVKAINDASLIDKELGRLDIRGNTPTYYAAISPHSDLLEEVLLHISDSDLRSRAAIKTLECLLEQKKRLGEEVYTLLLYGKLHQYLQFPVYIEHNSNVARDEMLRGVFTIKDLRMHFRSLSSFLWTKKYSDSAPNSLIWLHMPWNNAVLLHTLYITIQRYLNTRNTDVASPIEHEACRRIFHGSFLNLSIRPGNKWLQSRAPACNFFDNTEGAAAADYHAEGSPAGAMRSAAIVFPYLALESLASFKRVRQDHIDLCASLPGRDFIDKIQTERTLDEVHYPSLSVQVLDEYNEEQVVTRESKTSSIGGVVPSDNRPILMVKHLWIWRFGNYMMSSNVVFDKAPTDLLREEQSHHSRQLIELEGSPDGIDKSNYAVQQEGLRREIASEGDGWRTACIGPESRVRAPEPDIQIGLLMAMQVEKFRKSQPRYLFQSPLDYFEIGVARVSSDVSEYTRHTDTDVLDIKKEETFLRDLSDIRGELMTVDEVLTQQQEILEEFVAGAEPSAKSHRFFGRVTAAQKQLTGYRKRVAKIERDAERIDSMINAALDLKRTHASIQDARASLQDARSSLLLGWAVMGFTVITVLFAPIAFMTALFALPIDRLLNNQRIGTDAAGEPISVYTSEYVTWTFFVAEISALIITALAIWGALRLRDWIKPGPTANEKRPEVSPDEFTRPASSRGKAAPVESEPSGIRHRWRTRKGERKEEV